MSDAKLEKTTVNITVSGSNHTFVATGEVLIFDGFLRVYMESKDDEEGQADADDNMLPPLNEGENLPMLNMTATERFTQRPARYSEASLVRKMEELGIGRPSTYAPTISTIQNREYVEKNDKDGVERSYNQLSIHQGESNIADADLKEITGVDKGKLIPTDIGTVVNDFLMEYFPSILDLNFTANVEQEFDVVAEGGMVWTKAIDDFYKMFHPNVEEISAMRMERKVGERTLGIDPKTGREVSVKISRFGPVVQIGKQDEEEKPLFASLLKGQSMATIELEEALKLFDLPRTVGEYEGKIVKIGIGRFGPYIYHDSKYVSLPKEYEPMSVTLEESIALIEAKRKAEREKLIKTFEENEGLQILNGRYGPYITLDKANYKIPKDVEPKELSYDDCMAIIKEAEENPKATRGKKAPAKKTSTATKKTTAAKKTTAEKKTTTTKKAASTKKATATKTTAKKTTKKATTKKADDAAE